MKIEMKIERTTQTTFRYDDMTLAIDGDRIPRRELVAKLQAFTVALVTEVLGEAAGHVTAASQGEAAASVVLTLHEQAMQLGLADRRKAPRRRVTRSNGRGRTVTLECGHKFTVPGGHNKTAKHRRCVECLKTPV